MKHCIPDLPFMDMVVYLFKSIGAVFLVLGIFGAVIGGFMIGAGLLKNKGRK